jgi:membrane dipeptidase
MTNRALLVTGVTCLLGVAALAAAEDLAGRAKALHAAALVFDTHMDAEHVLDPGWRFADEHTTDHVDLPRLRKGGIDAFFFSVYMPGTVTGPKAVNDAMEMIAAMRKLATDLPDAVALCTTADEVRRAQSQKRIALLMGMEGGHMLNNSLAMLRTYATLGIRYLTLTHNVDTDWADAAMGKHSHNGLTSFGRDVVLELNRLGVIVDISHVADKTFWDALEVSRAPMIASHSSARAIAAHPRNMTDEMIKALAARGGVVHINYYTAFIDNTVAQYVLKAAPRSDQLELELPGRANEARRKAILESEFGPRPTTNWEKIVDHIDHAVQLVGVDHVGLGSDFDGATMPIGMDDTSKVPKITEELMRRGYRPQDIRKILGENTLRVMRDVERVAAAMQRETKKR